MTKEENGITIISLVVTLIVMLIIFGITFVSGTVLLEQSKKTKIETQLYLIKARAETLVEQYQFDGDLKHLLSFSKLESQNSNPVAYNYARENNVSYTSSDGTVFTTVTTDQFKADILKIYGLDIASAPIIENIEGAETETYGKYLFVKWGVNECLSQGIIKESDAINQNALKNAVINDKNGENKYAIVVYDIEEGILENVAYSIGFRNQNGQIEYTLEDIAAIDIEEED